MGAAKQPGLSDAAKAALAARFGLKAADVARKFLPGDSTAARNPETEEAFQAQRAGERADLSGAAGAGGVPSTLASGASPTTITGEFSPEIMNLVGGAGGAAIPSTLASGAPLTSITGELSPEIAGLLTSGASGAGTGAAGAAGAPAGGPAAGTGGLGVGGALGLGLGAAGTGLDIYNRAQGGMSAGQQAGEAAIETAGLALAPFTGGISAMVAPLVNMAIENIATMGDEYGSTRRTAYGKLAQGLEGGFAPSLQEAAAKGPEAVEALLTPEGLKAFGLEASRDPQTGEYTVGLSSAGHPYIKYTDALTAQTQLSQAVNQALQLSRASRLIQPPAEAPAPEQKPPTATAGGGPLGLAEIGLEVER